MRVGTDQEHTIPEWLAVIFSLVALLGLIPWIIGLSLCLLGWLVGEPWDWSGIAWGYCFAFAIFFIIGMRRAEHSSPDTR